MIKNGALHNKQCYDALHNSIKYYKYQIQVLEK